MVQKFYVDTNGKYLGSYDGPAKDNPYSGKIKVSAPSGHGRDNWNGASWDAVEKIPDIENIRNECRRRIKLDGHDLAIKKLTPVEVSATYIDDCVTACEILEGTLAADYLTSSAWPALPA